jgi:hypothetical protein
MLRGYLINSMHKNEPENKLEKVREQYLVNLKKKIYKLIHNYQEMMDLSKFKEIDPFELTTKEKFDEYFDGYSVEEIRQWIFDEGRGYYKATNELIDGFHQKVLIHLNEFKYIQKAVKKATERNK